MGVNPVGWFEIYVTDMDRAKHFYETVFNTKLERLSDPTAEAVTMWAFPSDMDAHGASGALGHMAEFPAGQTSTIVYFSCDDCAYEEAHALAAGGKIERHKMSIGDYGFISLVIDSEGNLIGLHSLR